ncbi:SDR family NAD(P)-dependent oxidoreductase [Pseudomonas sp. RIT-PI-q]|uniref:SDR family NAD(P)-dependent oxidoreductase n=1 Tax=Pseudomonas sp. RIT-PI-q TaxID=1690247 RepID=UPI000A6F7E01|nr:SDR family NAD(P)-dependent oxidoreductase [Pseudomonas sp. RIT-PI-q]
MNTQNFSAGQVAVVTGAARGIGLAIARRLAHQGVFVYLLDRDEQALNSSVSALQLEDLQVAGIALDLTVGESVNAAFAQIQQAHGRLDFLVNNAGVVRDKRFLNMTEQDWDLVVDTNLRAQFLCCKAALPLMLEKGFGRIVNMSSRAWLGGFGPAHYSAARGAGAA